MSYSFESLLKEILSVEEVDESRIPVEDAVDMDTSDTPKEEGETVEQAAENAEQEESENADEGNVDNDASGEETTDDAAVDAGEQAGDTLEDNAGAENTSETTDTEEGEGEENSEEESESEEDTETEDGEEVTEEVKEEAAEALENIRDAMLETLNRGGMTESEATVADMAIRDVAESVRLEDRRMVASVESFSERSSRRLLATNSAIDTINFYIAELRNK